MRVGGRLGCISALRSLEIFGFDNRYVHLHMPKQMSRSRSPYSRSIPLTPSNRSGAVLHWWPLSDPDAGTEFRVDVVDALAQAVRCQRPWHALASLENALFQGRINESQLTDVFRSVPEKHHFLRGQIDARSEAGQETVLRRALLEAGLRVEIQVQIAGVGRVDLVVEGRLIVEADSRQAHDGWELHVRDRDRDIDAARQGYVTLRPAYNRTMHTTADVVDAVLALLAATDRFRTIL